MPKAMPKKIALGNIPEKNLALIRMHARVYRGTPVSERVREAKTWVVYLFPSKSAAASWLVASLATLGRLAPRAQPGGYVEPYSPYNKILRYWAEEKERQKEADDTPPQAPLEEIVTEDHVPRGLDQWLY
jgi:hypothetical protein